jgi:hypothetical protein
MPVVNLNEDESLALLKAVQTNDMVWHRERGWLRPKKFIEAAQADVEAGAITREHVAVALGVDLAQVDADSAKDPARLKAFVSCDLAEPWIGTEPADDAWPYEITEAADPLAVDLTSRYSADEYDRLELSLNGAWTHRYPIRKEDSERLLRDIQLCFLRD